MITPFSHVLIRTPLNPLKQAYNFPEAYPQKFEDSLYISSPELWQEFQKNETLTIKEKNKMFHTLTKFWIRSSTRCTPYGSFAGCALIEIKDEETSILLNEPNKHKIHLRLDMNYIAMIIHSLEQVPVIYNQLEYFTNNSLYILHDKLRYVEYTSIGNIRKYHITSVELTDYLEILLDQAHKGTTINDLITTLLEIVEVSKDEAFTFIMNLIQAQLLISELEPSITGPDPLEHLINQLSKLLGVEELLTKLQTVNQCLHFEDKNISQYKGIEQKLTSIFPDIKRPKNTLQADMFLSIKKGQISNNAIQKILSQINKLMSLNHKGHNNELEHFKSKFKSRYEEAKVPLSLALDVEAGIGYAGIYNESFMNVSDLINDLPTPIVGEQPSAKYSPIHLFILKKYEDYLKRGDHHIELTDEEIDTFAKSRGQVNNPDGMFLMGNLIKSNNNIVDDFLFNLYHISGPSAANLLGRFAYGESEIYNFIKEILAVEEAANPTAIFAEIVHLPQARTGNIILRPLFRKYELPYLGQSGTDINDQITVDDLLVSVQDNQVILYSKRFDKQVLPRLTTAHNFSYKSLPIYKFLCDLQTQDVSIIDIWDWGFLSSLEHLPRVMYKNIIIKKARWVINMEQIKDLQQDASIHTEDLNKFRKDHNIPNRTVYVEGDNTLLIDFEKQEGIELFIYYLKKNKQILLEESLFSNENCIVSDIHGNSFTNEVIIPLKNKD